MALLISTNMYTAEDFRRVLPYLKKFNYEVGVEVFPMFHKTEYEEILQECLPELLKVPISFHGPYYGAEHSIQKPDEKDCGNGDQADEEFPKNKAEKGDLENKTEEGLLANKAGRYKRTMSMMQKTIEYGRYLKSRYLVYHHNNCHVFPENKEEMIRISCENFRKIEKMAKNTPVVVENAGVLQRDNMLFDQDEFVELCKRENYKVLIDIGHAHANGWELGKVMEDLQDRIVAYHLHNNDGIHDSHRRIHDGTLDFGKFLSDYKRLTYGADLVLEYSLEVKDDVEGIEEDVGELLLFLK